MTDQPITAEFVNDTADLADAVETRTAQIERFLDENRITGRWTDFVREAEKEAGTEPTRFHNCRHAQRQVDYVATVDRGTINFEGTDVEGDHHHYAIPVGFLFPETQEQTKDRFRAHLREVAEAEAYRAARHREETLARKRAEIARLEAEVAADQGSPR